MSEIRDNEMILVEGFPISNNYVMRAWMARNLAFNPQTEISEQMHLNGYMYDVITPDRDIYVSATHNIRCQTSRAIRLMDAQTDANLPYYRIEA